MKNWEKCQRTSR